MKYLAAYALVAISNPAPSKKDVEAVLKAAGAKIDAGRMDALFKELEGKKIDDLIKSGMTKCAGGGGGGAAAPAAAGKPAAGKAAAKAEEPEEEEDDMFGGGLFD